MVIYNTKWVCSCYGLAAIASIGVSYGYAVPGELEQAGADYIMDTVQELEKLLAG